MEAAVVPVGAVNRRADLDNRLMVSYSLESAMLKEGDI